MPAYRKERLEKQIRIIIADSLLKEVKDPRIGFATVTDVKLNKDKSAAIVSVSVLGDDKSKKKTMKGLESARGYLQFKIGKGIKMRNTPKIIFHLDSSIETGTGMVDTIDKIIKEEKIKRDSMAGENIEEEEEDDDDDKMGV